MCAIAEVESQADQGNEHKQDDEETEGRDIQLGSQLSCLGLLRQPDEDIDRSLASTVRSYAEYASPCLACSCNYLLRPCLLHFDPPDSPLQADFRLLLRPHQPLKLADIPDIIVFTSLLLLFLLARPVDTLQRRSWRIHCQAEGGDILVQPLQSSP